VNREILEVLFIASITPVGLLLENLRWFWVLVAIQSPNVEV